MSGSSNIGTYVSIESANNWQYVELTFEELGVTTGEDFKCFEIQNRLSSPTNYYFDNVKLIRSNISTRVCADGTISSESDPEYTSESEGNMNDGTKRYEIVGLVFGMVLLILLI
ncbi:hypothetical protein QTN25_002537 [Entamoeba marina]